MNNHHVTGKKEMDDKVIETNHNNFYLSSDKMNEKKILLNISKNIKIFEEKESNKNEEFSSIKENENKLINSNKHLKVFEPEKPEEPKENDSPSKEDKKLKSPKKKKPLKFSKKNKMLFREFLKLTLIKKGDKELLLMKCLKKEPQNRSKEDNNTIKNFLRNTKMVDALLEIPFFLQKNCDNFLTSLSGEIRLRTMKKDDIIFDIGSKPDNFYFIYDGSVSIEFLESYSLSLTCKQYIKSIITRYQKISNHKDKYLRAQSNIFIFKKNKESEEDVLNSKYVLNKILKSNKHIINIKEEEFPVLNLILLVIDIKNILLDIRGNYNSLIMLIQNYNYDEKKILANMDQLANNFNVSNYQFNVMQIYKNIPEVNPDLIEKYEHIVESYNKYSFTFFRKGKIVRLQNMGDCFGDLTHELKFYNIIHNDDKRNYSASVLENANLAYINYDKFFEILKLERQEIKHSEAKFLKNSFFFQEINQYLLEKKLLKYFMYEELQYNNYLFKEGQKDIYIYFLKFGKYEISCNQNIKNACLKIEDISQNYLSDPTKKEDFTKMAKEILKNMYFCNFIKKEYLEVIPLKLLVLSKNFVLGIESVLNKLPYLYDVKILSEKCGYYKIELHNLLELMKELKDGKEILIQEKNSYLELFLERLVNLCKNKVEYLNTKNKLNINIQDNIYNKNKFNKGKIKSKVIINKIKDFLFNKNKRYTGYNNICMTTRNEDISIKKIKSRVKLYFLTEVNNAYNGKMPRKRLLNEEDNKTLESTYNQFYNKYSLKNSHFQEQKINNYNYSLDKYNKTNFELKEIKGKKIAYSFFNKSSNSRNIINNMPKRKYNSLPSNKILKNHPKYNPIGIKQEEILTKMIKNTLENELLFFNSFNKNELSGNTERAFLETKTDLKRKKVIPISEKKMNENKGIVIKKNIPNLTKKFRSTRIIQNINLDFPIQRQKSRASRNFADYLQRNDSKNDSLNLTKYTLTDNHEGNNWVEKKINNDKTPTRVSIKDKCEKNRTLYGLKNEYKSYLKFNRIMDNLSPIIESYSFKGKKYSISKSNNCYNKKLYKAMKERVEDDLFMNGQTPIPKINF